MRHPVARSRSGAALRIALTGIGLAAILFPSAPGRANGVVSEFIPIGDLPGGDVNSQADGVSDDGSVVVGASWPGVNPQAIRWTRSGGIESLGDLPGGTDLGFALGVSGDGTVAVGGSVSTFSSGSGNEGFRWTAPGPMEPLGSLLGGLDVSVARRASTDGSVIVGTSSSGTGLFHAFKWTAAGGMVGLTDGGGAFFHTDAYDVSADGGLIVGRATPNNVNTACRWTSPNAFDSLGDLPGGDENSIAFGCDADASVVVGQSTSGNGIEAFRWVEGAGMQPLGDLPGGEFVSSAQACSADGSVVVGYSSSDNGQEAFVWTQADGMKTIRQALRERGVFAAEEWQLTVAMDVSADGSVVVGHGINQDGNPEGWVAVLGEPLVPTGELFPKLVSVAVNKNKPHRSSLKITGQFDCGVDPVNWAAPCIATLGDLGTQTGPLVQRRPGKPYVYREGGLEVIVTPSPHGSSKTLYSVTFKGDLDDAPLEGIVGTSLISDAVSGASDVRLASGKYKHGRKGALVKPHLHLLSAKAGFSGRKADTLKLEFSLATDRVVPSKASSVTIEFGDTFAETLPDDRFVLKRSTKWVATGPAPGITSVVCDYKKEKLTLIGSKLALGPFVVGSNEVRIRIVVGGEERSATVLMIRKKQARKDVLLY